MNNIYAIIRHIWLYYGLIEVVMASENEKKNCPMGSWTIITFLLKNRIKYWEQILDEAVLSFKLVCTGGFEARSCYGGRIFSIIIITFSAIWLLTLHWFFTDSSSDLYFEVVCTGGVEARGCYGGCRCSIMIIILVQFDCFSYIDDSLLFFDLKHKVKVVLRT